MGISTKSSAALARHRIKFLTLVMVILLTWGFIRYEGYHEISEHVKNIQVPEALKNVPETIKHIDVSETIKSATNKVFHSAGNGPGTAREVLAEAEAAQFCSFYRLDALDREAARKRKIFDLMLVNTELDMLEVRMGQMTPGVDHFIILEADKTFSGKDKPLYVQENWDRFKRHHPKIIRKTMDLDSDEFNGAWSRESASRNSMYTQVIPFLEGDQAASPNDVILVSDIDEIFKPKMLRLLRNCLIPDTVTAQSQMYYYSFQWKVPGVWENPRAMLYHGADKQELLPDALRGGNVELKIEDGGWHCSYCFRRVQELITKISSFSHTEYDKPEYKDPAQTVLTVRNGWDVFRRGNWTRMIGKLDLPDYVEANKDKYKHLIDRDPANANFVDWDPVAGTVIERSLEDGLIPLL